MSQCQQLHYVDIGVLDDGFTGSDGELGSMRLRQCKRPARTEIALGSGEIMALCAQHVGSFMAYGHIYFVQDGQYYDVDAPSLAWMRRV